MFAGWRTHRGPVLAGGVWLVLAAGVCAWCWSQDAQPARSAESPRRQALLLLTTGRIVEGILSQSPGGYMVELPHGSVLVPFEQVVFEARDLREAYAKLRKTMPERTATRHISLARWCLRYQLVDEARRELVDALELEPQRELARSMLRRLQVGIAEEEDTPIASGAAVLVANGLTPPEVESLAGLSRETAQQFVVKVQPILMNKCGFARCHGSAARNEFRLTPVRGGAGSHRVFAERNLAAVLSYLDTESPKRSPLLTVSSGNHGPGGRAVFYGARAAEQRQTLEDWVLQVAAERQESLRQERRKPSLASLAPPRRFDTFTEAAPEPTAALIDDGDALPTAPLGMVPTGGAVDFSTADAQVAAGSPMHGVAPAADDLSVPVRRFDREQPTDTPLDSDDERLQRLLRRPPADAFDPERFNRAVHGEKSERPQRQDDAELPHRPATRSLQSPASPTGF